VKDKLIIVINSIMELLIECNLVNKADWFKAKLEIIQKNDEHSEKFNTAIGDIKKVIAGMGSFTDISMMPKQDSKLSEREARLKKFYLAEQLDEVIIALLKKNV